MSSGPSNKELARRSVYHLNQQDFETLDDYFRTDVRTHLTPFAWTLESRGEWEAFLMELFDAVPDLWLTIEDLVAEAECVVVRCSLQGTLTDHLGGTVLEPTWRRFEAPGTIRYRFDRHLIAETWLMVDLFPIVASQIQDD